MLRYVGETDATVWVETDAPCTVEACGTSARTFEVDGHHYALLCIEDLEPGETRPYTVSLDGEQVWPEPDDPLPAPTIRTPRPDQPIRMTWGSCRVAAPHEQPHSLAKEEDPHGRGIDALYAYALRMVQSPESDWPQLCMLLGDQVYADEVSPKTREWIRTRRDPSKPPGEQVADFEEYCRLYQESWRDPVIRWLFSTVPTAMIWDDHDVHDDWNCSRDWVEKMRSQPWWTDRIVGAIMSYWVYQHLGNLSPRELDENEVYGRARGNQHATEELRAWAESIDSTEEGTRWSFCRDFGRTRAIFIDARAGRVLEPGGRAMVDEQEWNWILEHSRGDFDHLLIGTTVPLLLTRTFHALEAWNERVCDGAWGGPASKLGEKLRRALDFDHWASFQRSFGDLTALMEEVAKGEHGGRPASIVVLSGDVHHAYLCDVAYRGSGAERAPVYQAVCSPYRNPLDAKERRVIRTGFKRWPELIATALARLAGAPSPDLRWRMLEGPHFDNQVATLELAGRSATLRLEKTIPNRGPDQRLEQTFERRLA
jgi:PhoD-like phosphatase